MRLADDSTPMEKRDSRWVIWAQFELFVDEIMSIVELYHARLDWFQGRLHKEEADFPKEDIKSIIQTVDELERLQRRLLPVRRVVGHLIELQSASGSDGDGGGDVTPLEEVGDCYQEALEEIGVMLGQLERLKDEFNTYKDGRMNEILCVLLPY